MERDANNYYSIIQGYALGKEPSWLTKSSLSKFKRNFHIFEQTGLMKRTSNGIKLSQEGISSFRKICVIAEIDTYFSAFEGLSGLSTNEFDIRFEQILRSQAWDRYYDGANLPLYVIQEIAGIVDIDPGYGNANTPDSSSLPVSTEAFPTLTQYVYHNRAQYAINDSRMVDLQAAIVTREKANCEHERIVQMLNANLLLLNAEPRNNIFIDLYADIGELHFLFEVKSTTERNYISQIRKGISQLYEYRFRLNQPLAIPCLVLQNKPKEPWVIDYLTRDRGISVFWLVDEVRFECPTCCANTFKPFESFIHVECTD